MACSMSASVATVETAQAEMTAGSACSPEQAGTVAQPSEDLLSGSVDDSGDPLNKVQNALEIMGARKLVLTARQRMVLDFIRSSVKSRGYPPSMREIGKHMGIRSTNGVNDHLRAIERKGYILRSDLLSRGIQVVGNPDNLPPDLLQVMREENLALRVLLGRVADAVRALPRLTPQLTVLAGDIRQMLGRRP